MRQQDDNLLQQQLLEAPVGGAAAGGAAASNAAAAGAAAGNTSAGNTRAEHRAEPRQRRARPAVGGGFLGMGEKMTELLGLLVMLYIAVRLGLLNAYFSTVGLASFPIFRIPADWQSGNIDLPLLGLVNIWFLVQLPISIIERAFAPVKITFDTTFPFIHLNTRWMGWLLAVVYLITAVYDVGTTYYGLGPALTATPDMPIFGGVRLPRTGESHMWFTLAMSIVLALGFEPLLSRTISQIIRLFRG